MHIIATSGGMDKNTRQWEHMEYLPYRMLHKKWQWYLLEMIKERIDTEEIEQLVDSCYRRYPKGGLKGYDIMGYKRQRRLNR